MISEPQAVTETLEQQKDVLQTAPTPEGQESQEVKITVEASGTEQQTEVSVEEKTEEINNEGKTIKSEEGPGPKVPEQQLPQDEPKDLTLTFDKAIGKEQTITVTENVETIEGVEKTVEEPVMIPENEPKKVKKEIEAKKPEQKEEVKT